VLVKICKVGAKRSKMFMRTNHYAIKMHEITFVKYFNMPSRGEERREEKISVICF
jgi:hypothetical protein